MKVFGIFEGGGVRGYAHLGALRALERRGVEFEAVAGTSIGAIVAVLVAAGCKADDLFRDGDQGHSGLGALSKEDLFSPRDLKVAERIRRDLDTYRALMRLLRLLKLPSPFDIRSSFLVVLGCWLIVPIAWLLTPIPYIRHRRAVSRLWRDFGLVGSETARQWLDNALRTHLQLQHAERPLLFGDLPIPLRVIVSDVETGSLRVAGADPGEPLVEAVLASASFPLFFRPDVSTGGSLVDGGILSNLPAWVFDRQRAASPTGIPTIALRLVGVVTPPPPLTTLFRFVPRLLATILDGARDLQFRRIDQHHLIPLPAEIDVLDFHKMEQQRSALVTAGEAAVDSYFDKAFGPVDPDRATALLAAVAAHTRQQLGTSAVVRAWVLIVADDEFLRLSYSANMLGDADDQLLIRRSSPGVASAFARREPVLVSVPTLSETFRQDPRFKYEHALRSPTVVTVCALPIFADPTDWGRGPKSRSEPIAILGIDLDEDTRLAFLSVSIEDRLATYAQIVGEVLRDRDVSPLSSTPTPRPVSVQSTLRSIAPGVEIYQRKVRSLVFDADTARLLSEVERPPKPIAPALNLGP